MVVGNGMVAKRFGKYANDENFLIFASGVSNSKSADKIDYLREYNLIKESLESNTEKTFVYFSTTSINDPSEVLSQYVAHKLDIEHFISRNASNYVIFRVSNLVGKSSNPNTVLNFFTHNVNAKNHFDLWINASRNLIDIDDFYSIADYILQNKVFLNTVVNIANPQSYTVKEIIEAIESFYNNKASFNVVNKGSYFNIDVSQIQVIIENSGLHFNDNYLLKMLNKYY